MSVYASVCVSQRERACWRESVCVSVYESVCVCRRERVLALESVSVCKCE